MQTAASPHNPLMRILFMKDRNLYYLVYQWWLRACVLSNGQRQNKRGHLSFTVKVTHYTASQFWVGESSFLYASCEVTTFMYSISNICLFPVDFTQNAGLCNLHRLFSVGWYKMLPVTFWSWRCRWAVLVLLCWSHEGLGVLINTSYCTNLHCITITG